jgi:hypothetical protein
VTGILETAWNELRSREAAIKARMRDLEDRLEDHKSELARRFASARSSRVSSRVPLNHVRRRTGALRAQRRVGRSALTRRRGRS